jgi:hypothetical protein
MVGGWVVGQGILKVVGGRLGISWEDLCRKFSIVYKLKLENYYMVIYTLLLHTGNKHRHDHRHRPQIKGLYFRPHPLQVCLDLAVYAGFSCGTSFQLNFVRPFDRTGLSRVRLKAPLIGSLANMGLFYYCRKSRARRMPQEKRIPPKTRT